MSGRCAALVVAYNSRAELPGCLAALAAQEGVDLRVTVVDNASSDGTADWVAAAHLEVELVRNASNVGFGPANNQVFAGSSADWFALVNPDAVPPPDAIATCIDALERGPDLAVAACRLVHPDGSLQPSCHAFPGVVNLLGEALFLDHVFPGTPLGGMHMVGFDHAHERRVDWIQGAFLVLRGDDVRRLGGFDPEFFMYGEEMDWCRRAHDAGRGVLFLPAPSVAHVGGASSRPRAGAMFVELLKSRLRYQRKHQGPLEAAACGALLVLGTLVRWPLWEALGLLGPLAPVDRAVVRVRVRMFRAAMAWILRGCPLGPPAP